MYFAPLSFFGSIFCLAFVISRVESEIVFECNTGSHVIVICRIPGIESSTSVIRIKGEIEGKDCDEGHDFHYEYNKDYEPHEVWVYVYRGCGGTFKLVTNSNTSPTWLSWGAWGTCSVSCGSGAQSRTRTCSTGNSADCHDGSIGDKVSKSCNYGSCSKTPENTASFCGRASPSFSYRIMGGQQAKKCEFPWMVMVYNKRIHKMCAGSILDRNRILTAAHCVTSRLHIVKASDFTIFSGANLMPFEKNYRNIEGLKLRYVSKITSHRNFDASNYAHDIGVVTLTEPIQFDECHVPICLPNETPLSLSGCKVTGWGKTSNGVLASISPNLLFTDVNINKPSVCENTYLPSFFHSNRQICAGGNGHGSCQGDSGGPLVCLGADNRYYQYGIVSSGSLNNCGKAAGIYTKVSHYRAWMKTGQVSDDDDNDDSNNSILDWWKRLMQQG